MPRGGYQRPSNPSPVSGPGALSKRTDGGPVQNLTDLPNSKYGENADYRNLQQSAPLAQTPSPGAATPASGGGGTPPPNINFGGPTQFPDRPVTHGAEGGPGAGPEALGVDNPGTDSPQDLDRLRSYLPALVEMASRPDSTSSFRNYVRVLRAKGNG